MGSVEGVEDELDAVLLVLAVQLGVAVVIADQCAAVDAVDVPGAEVAARAVVREVTGSPVGVDGADPFVVSLDALARSLMTYRLLRGLCVPLSRCAEPSTTHSRS